MLSLPKCRRTRLHVQELEDRRTPATLPAGFTESNISGVLSSPTTMRFAPDGRLFVLEQGGTLEVYTGSGAAPWTQSNANYFNASPITVDPSGERGLLGIAFDPNYLSNRYVYIYYTVPAAMGGPFNRISRFTSNAAGTAALAGSELIMVNLDPLSGATNHNGGALNFGPDGMLYAAVGENANAANAQSIANRLGKLLRINPYDTVAPIDYIPADNPMSIAGIAGTPTGNNRMIWAAGLRNPFTFGVHPTTGRMHINDVGQNTWEEINVAVRGANYGWSATEGTFTPTSFPNFQHPWVVYHHTNGALNYPAGSPNYTGNVIGGGSFYAGATAYPFPAEYVNDYFYGDVGSSFIRRYDKVSNTVHDFATGASNPVDIQVGPDGCLYYLTRGTQRVVRVTTAVQTTPYIVTEPVGLNRQPGQTATFTVAAGGNVNYEWRRDNMPIPGAPNAPSYTTPALALGDNGAEYSVVVSNTAGSATSINAVLSVTTALPPAPVITSPALATNFSYGDTINFSGTATDPVDGVLGASAFTWQIDYYTNGVQRPAMPPTPGITSGSYVIPNISPYTLSDVFHRVILTVTNSAGVSTTVSRDLYPRDAQVSVQSSPVAVPLQLDSQPITSPTSFVGVAGQLRNLTAPVQATVSGRSYRFTSWSDGGARVHDISSPSGRTIYTANFTLSAPRVASVDIDDGTTGQRSRIRSLKVTYDAIVTYAGAAADAYTLTGGAGITLVPGAIDNSSGRSVVTIGLSGAALENGSLPNGLYTFGIVGSQVRDSGLLNLDGDANGTAGGDFSLPFHRLFGDSDGDRDVDVTDLAALRMVFGGTGTTGFVAAFDFDNDGDVDASDMGVFRAAFGSMI